MTLHSATSSGTLYIVATPIGHLDDITLRALTILKAVSLILVEDTRHAKKLLSAHGIHQPLQAFHAHNEHTITPMLLQRLAAGESMALISDAGTPLIQDPGFPLVQLANTHQIPVVPIPGPCALIAALSVAGIACDRFLFAGFLPAKSAARQTTLAACKNAEHTCIFYESTHRIHACLEDIGAVFGASYEFVLAKELTKTFERVIHGTASTLLAFLAADPNHAKGEFVLLLPPVPIEISEQADDHLLSTLLAVLPLKQAVNTAAQLSQTAKNQLYQRALILQKQ